MLVIGNQHHQAFWDWQGAVLILPAVLILGLAVVAPSRPFAGAGLAWVGLLVGLLLLGGLHPLWITSTSYRLLVLAAVVTFIGCSLHPRLVPWRLPLTAALLVFSQVLMIMNLHPTVIDVYVFLTRSTDRLLQLQNPYAPLEQVPEGAITPGPWRLTYPPGILLFLAPLRILRLDIRWAYVLAAAASILLMSLFARSRGNRSASLDALILMPLAQTRLTEALYEFSNTEWVMLLLVAGVLIAKERSSLAGLVLGLGAATKQYFVLFPVLYLLPHLRRRSLVIGAATLLAICLPFAIWNLDLFLTGLKGATVPLDQTRVTFGTAVLRLTHHDLSIPIYLLGIGAALALAIALVRLGWIRERGLLASGATMALIAAFSTYSAYNYFFYATGLVAWGLIPIVLSAERKT
jgi:hypothetical protein